MTAVKRPAQRTITVEEHFWTPELAQLAGMELVSPLGGLTDRQLRDLGAGRLALMDAAGIDLQIISHAAPAAQSLPAELGRRLAGDANDALAAAVLAHPDRFAGLATLPTSDPAAAAAELERCVRDLGFVGAMLNSTWATNGRFLDDQAFDVLLDRFEALDVPLYLHPSPPPADVRETFCTGLEELPAWLLASSGWLFHAEAGLHVLRLVLGGAFDRHPGLRVVAGHGGEMLPFMLARLDRVLSPEVTGLTRPISSYLLEHLWITTSGMFTVPPVICAIEVFGVERVLFSVDSPYSPDAAGRALLDALPLTPDDQALVAGGNAEALFGLPVAPPAPELVAE